MEDFSQRFLVAKLIGLVPSLLHGDDLGFNGTRIVLGDERRENDSD
jgi:hypothetical protein